MNKNRIFIILVVTLLSLGMVSVALAATATAGNPPPEADYDTESKIGAEEVYAPFTSTPAGIMAVSYVYTSTTPAAIPDSGCAAGNYVTSTLTVPDNFMIGDLNVGLWLTHTYRGDLEIRLVSPGGTVVQLIQDPDGSADNVNPLIDDASPNAPDSTTHNPPPPYYYAWWHTTGALADFNGEQAQGTWTVEACDDAGGDTGTLNTWTLFFQSGLVLNPPEQSAEACIGDDVTYSFQVLNATNLTQTFTIDYTSVWTTSGPSVTPALPPGAAWDFDAIVQVPWGAYPGDSDVLTVTVSGGGDSAMATATTTIGVVSYRDYADAPRPVRDQSVVYYDGKIYKIGGYDGGYRDYVDIYDIATDSWTQGAPMPLGRDWIDCVEIGGKIYCAGGYNASGQTTLYIYDPPLDSWSSGAPLSAYVYNYAGVALNGKYYVIGGYAAGYSSALLEYDPVTDTWNYTLASMSTPRRYFHAGVIGGKIYVAGGYNPTYLSSGEVYDPVTDTWTPIASMPTTWNRGGDAVLNDRYLLIFGGDDNSTATSQPTVWLYDAVLDTWSSQQDMPHALYGTEADSDGNGVWISSGRLYEGAYRYSEYHTYFAICPCSPVYGADFTVDPLEPWAGVPAIFLGSVAGASPPVTYDWDFGDMGTGQGQTVEHTYDLANTYTVIMTATNCGGANYSIATHDVTVVLPPIIGVDPASLHSIQFPNEVTTQTLDVCNLGDQTLNWELSEIPLSEPPIGDAWETMTPLPAGRVFNAVIAEGSYVYVIGGTSDAGGTTPTDTIYRYDTMSNVWDTLTPMPTTLSFIDGIAIGGEIYIPGDGITSTTFVYDIAADSWSSIPSNGGYPPTEGYQVVAIDTDLYVLGGITGGASTTTVWILDTLSGTWAPGVPMQNSRINFSAAAIDGNIYVAGGVAYPGFTPDMTAEMFDGLSWSYIAPLPDGGGAYTRWSYNADGHGRDGLWLAAGRRDAGWTILNHAGYYDPDTDTWTDSPIIPMLSQGRVYMEGDVAADGYFYVIGGRDSAGAVIYDTNERLFVGYPMSFDVPWLSESPLTGALPGGMCELVNVVFDSTNLDPDDYLANLAFDSNDPSTPQLIVPVTLTVEGWATIVVDPTSLSNSQPEGVTVTLPLTISNLGNIDLDWAFVGGTTFWMDDFDSYTPGSQMHGQGGWKGWDNNPAAGALVTDLFSHTPNNSIDIVGASDLVHEYSGYTSGSWVYTIWQYIPSGMTGQSYFLLLNTYNDTGPYNWSTQVVFDYAAGQVVNEGDSGGTLPLISDQWVEIRVEIDLDNDIQAFYYGGDLLFQGTWTEEMSGGGVLNIGAVDLFANGASSVYYDTVSLVMDLPDCEAPSDIPWLSLAPDSGTTPPMASSLVDVTLDSTGLALGDYMATLCVESNDLVNPITSVPVTLTVQAEVLFMYHDVEDVVQMGEDVFLAGSFNGWDPSALMMIPNADYSVFTVTVPLSVGDYEYKYIAQPGDNWDWLNTGNRGISVAGDMTAHDYRNVVVGYAHLMEPPTMTIYLGESTDPIYGEDWIYNVTNPDGEGRSVMAQLGYGTGTDLDTWMWMDITYDSQNGNNDVYMGVFTPTATGVYSYAVRFDGNWGVGNPNVGWTYGDLDGVYPEDPFELANTGVLTVLEPPIALADLSLTKADDPDPVYTSGSLTYTLVVVNDGPSPAVNVMLTDTLPADVTFVTASHIGCAEDAGVVTCDLGDLTSSEGITLSITVLAPDTAGTITNTAEVSSDTLDPDTTDNIASEDTEVMPVGYMIYLPIVIRD